MLCQCHVNSYRIIQFSELGPQQFYINYSDIKINPAHVLRLSTKISLLKLIMLGTTFGASSGVRKTPENL